MWVKWGGVGFGISNLCANIVSLSVFSCSSACTPMAFKLMILGQVLIRKLPNLSCNRQCTFEIYFAGEFSIWKGLEIKLLLKCVMIKI